MIMTNYEQSAFRAVLEYATDSQKFCKENGDMMTQSELRQHIAKVNRVYDLRPALLDAIAREIEADVGVAFDLAD